MEFTVSSRTDTGRSRTNNEDAVLTDPPLIAVADGMGGHAFGEVAASTALEAVGTYKDQLHGLAGLEAATKLAEAVAHANETVYKRGQENEELTGMGTTLTAGWVADDALSLAHVGDSRAYLLRGSKLQQLTEDQNVVQELVRRGRLSPEEAANDPRRHIVLQAIGIDMDELDVEQASVPLRPGDRIVFATDGLFGMVRDDATLRDLLLEHRDGDAACGALIDAANNAGGQDNITVIIVDVAGDPAAATSDGEVEDVDIERTSTASSVATGPPSARAEARVPSRLPRLALVLGGAVLLAVAMAAFLFLRPSGPSYVVATRGENVVILDGDVGMPGEPAEGEVIRRTRWDVEDFNDTTQEDLRSGFDVETLAEADALLRRLPKQLGPKDTPTPEPTGSASPKTSPKETATP
ncbi:MAG: PP2C family serine/threonine-protein phosphatase [Actinomycetota bacterium]